MPCAIVARHGVLKHVIYDEAMRRFIAPFSGALAFLALTGFSWAASAETTPTTSATTSTTSGATTTSSPPVVPTTSTTVTSPPTTAPAKGATTTTSTTAKAGTGQPVPPPASGPSQPLDPTLLGDTIIPLNTSTTLFGVETTLPSTTTTSAETNALSIHTGKNGPSGPTLGLAAVAWLASLGGLLVYAEDQRSKQWRHLAR